jgi:hypothetical protein
MLPPVVNVVSSPPLHKTERDSTISVFYMFIITLNIPRYFPPIVPAIKISLSAIEDGYTDQIMDDDNRWSIIYIHGFIFFESAGRRRPGIFACVIAPASSGMHFRINFTIH